MFNSAYAFEDAEKLYKDIYPGLCYFVNYILLCRLITFYNMALKLDNKNCNVDIKCIIKLFDNIFSNTSNIMLIMDILNLMQN